MKFKSFLSILLVFIMLFSVASPVYALSGGTGGGGGTGVVGGNLPAGNPVVDRGYGYRVYLVNKDIVNLETNQWGQNGDVNPYLSASGRSTRAFAIYEIYGVGGGGFANLYKTSPNHTLYNWVGNGRYGALYEAEPGSPVNRNPNHFFRTLFKGTSAEGNLPPLPHWGFQGESGVRQDQVKTSEWADAAFLSLNTVEDVDQFLNNYSAILRNNGVSQTDIDRIMPQNAEDFLKGEWGIVFEPVYIASVQGDFSTGVALGYHDIDDFYRTIGYTGPCRINVRRDILGGLYNDFVSKNTGVHITTKGNNRAKGFALYLLEEQTDLELGTEATHGASFNFVMQSGKIDANRGTANVSSGALLTSNTVVSPECIFFTKR